MSDPVRSALCEAVDGAVLMGHMQELARWVKLSGTPDELQSLRYFQARLDEYGYRTKLIMHDAYISLPGKARVDVDNQTLTSITHSFSRTSPASGVTGRLVYVGDGDEADFTGRDLRGAIVLIGGHRQSRPGRTRLARRRGGTGADQPARASARDVRLAGVGQPVRRDAIANCPPPSCAPCRTPMASALRERLARGEQPKVTLHAEVDTGWRPTPILEAEIDGPDGGRAVHPVLRPSRHLALRRDGQRRGQCHHAGGGTRSRRASKREWRRGLRLCFWSGHSHGRYSGSTWYADQNWDELERRCAVHVNVDSTGGVGAVVLKNAAAAPELVALAGDAIGEQAGSDYAGKRMSRSSRPVVLGHRHSRDVRRAQRTAAGAGEDAQRTRLVVAHAARPAGQDR